MYNIGNDGNLYTGMVREYEMVWWWYSGNGGGSGGGGGGGGDDDNASLYIVFYTISKV